MSRRHLRLLVPVVAALATAATLAGISLADSSSVHRAAVTPPPGALTLQAAFEKVVQAVSPSVVQIETSSGLGSGIVFDGKGDVVTNNHVVTGSSTFKVTTSSGKELSAKLVGSFPPDDLAVIRVSGGSLRPAPFADSSKLQVGQLVLAIGNPLGLRSSVTEGIVSAIRGVQSEGQGVALPSAIQTSAAINPGNSGGALVDLEGRVVGIPTLAATDPQLGGAAVGIGFAIPSNLVKDIAGQLIAHGKVVDSHRAYLGIRPGDTNGSGTYVGELISGGPAAKAGIKAGDVITSIAGKPTPTVDDLSTVLAGLKPGQKVAVALIHQDGAKATVQVTLGTLPGTP